jgi:hypothetical protein
MTSQPTHSLTKNVSRLALTGFCCIVLAGCQSPDDKVLDAKEKVGEANQELKEAGREARVAWQEEWLSFKRQNDEEIAKSERTILALRAEVAQIDMRYREKYTTRIGEIERRNEELRNRVNNYKDEGDERWSEFKKDVERERDDIQLTLKSITVKNG